MFKLKPKYFEADIRANWFPTNFQYTFYIHKFTPLNIIISPILYIFYGRQINIINPLEP